ncbi:MAG: hypothetical protein JXR67_03980 [Bacteroidales bacterium]|nr:hypothetical protein [Bacteroidales bacterium]
MKSRNIISSLVNPFLGIVFLAGSIGITLIIHDCSACNVYFAHAGIYFSSAEHQDHCCDDADTHCMPENEAAQGRECCNFSIEELKITEYTPAFPVPLSAPAELPARFLLHDPDPVHHPVPVPRDFPDKHGGRFLLTCNCQFLS